MFKIINNWLGRVYHVLTTYLQRRQRALASSWQRSRRSHCAQELAAACTKFVPLSCDMHAANPERPRSADENTTSLPRCHQTTAISLRTFNMIAVVFYRWHGVHMALLATTRQVSWRLSLFLTLNERQRNVTLTRLLFYNRIIISVQFALINCSCIQFRNVSSKLSKYQLLLVLTNMPNVKFVV